MYTESGRGRSVPYEGARENICRTIEEQYNKHDFLLDVMLEPRTGYRQSEAGTHPGDGGSLDAIIIEFKIQSAEERELTDTVREALRQIEEKAYQTNLTVKGIPAERIRKYGFCPFQIACGEGQVPYWPNLLVLG